MNGTFRGGLCSQFFGDISLTTSGALAIDRTVAPARFTILQELSPWFRTESMA